MTMKKMLELFTLIVLLGLLAVLAATGQNVMFMSSTFVPPAPCPPCMDTFAGTSGTPLPSHNAIWQDVDASYLAHCAELTGGPGVTAQHGCMGDVAGAVYSTSLSDTSQVVLQANAESTNFQVVCARCGSGTLGYNVGVGLSAGAITGCIINKDTTNLGFNSFSIAAGDHKVAVVLTGTTSTQIDCVIDGTVMYTLTDSSSPILPSPAGHPGFLVSEGFNYGTWGDYLF